MRQEFRDKVDEIDLKLLLVVAIGLQLAVLAIFTTQTVDITDFLSTGEDNSQDLTRYQEVYVDCPDKYLEVCTQLSRVPTEEVSFQKVEDGRIYLDMESGRTMIAELKEDGGAEIVAMKRPN